MRSFYTVELLEVVVLAAALWFASAAMAEVVSVFDREPPAYDPCRDGRYSQGRPMDCAEVLRQLDRDEAWARRHRFDDAGRRPVDPCQDGRYSTGRPMTCGELRERLDRQERRRYQRYEDDDGYGSGQVVEPVFMK
ncbi:hypothetical protein [Variovorax sp. EL159]|uniref:hypothetical protein n=1 Tax=Variovorax sp. EL159 TaxID=1566270 RepID=UPI00088A96F7|nr:hypothetical protein [Variovorax sp. EL159]SCX74510.1 hypothetical protein SAMN03159363_6255 [Variovorax sp. EL159]